MRGRYIHFFICTHCCDTLWYSLAWHGKCDKGVVTLPQRTFWAYFINLVFLCCVVSQIHRRIEESWGVVTSTSDSLDWVRSYLYKHFVFLLLSIQRLQPFKSRKEGVYSLSFLLIIPYPYVKSNQPRPAWWFEGLYVPIILHSIWDCWQFHEF